MTSVRHFQTCFRIWTVLACMLLWLPTQVSAQVSGRTLRLSGPPVADSLPLVHMAASEAPLPGIADACRMVPWVSPDQLRAMITGGQTDVVIATISTLATLHAKGMDVRIAALASPPGWIVSSASPPNGATPTIAALRNRTLLLPFGPGEMPGVVVRTLVEASGLDPEKDMRLRYTGSAMEAVQLLLLGKGTDAYLSEPAATLACLRSRETNTPLHKSIDINQAWATAFPEAPRLVTAIGVLGDLAHNATAVASIGQAFAQAFGWVLENQDTARQQADRIFPALARQLNRYDQETAASSLVEYDTGKRSAMFLLRRMFESNPSSIGGRMPDDTFWIPKQ